MKITEIKDTEIAPGNVRGFHANLSKLSEKDCKLFISEFLIAEYKETQNNALHLMQLLAQNQKLEFIWLPLYKKELAEIWARVKTTLERGYFLGMNEYLPYPEKLKALFLVVETDVPTMQEYLKKLFASPFYTGFQGVCAIEASIVSDDTK